MNRKDFGKLLISLRREHLDGNLKTWTRQKFSEESKIDGEILANVETGRKANLYPEMLVQLANTLKLTSGERREWLRAASGVDEKDICPHPRGEKAREEMFKLLDETQLPAILLDQFFDILAVNQMALEVLNLTPTAFVPPAGDAATRANLLRLLFSPEFDQRALLGDKLEDAMLSVMLAFRSASLRYRASAYLQRLLRSLNALEDFKIYFQRAGISRGESPVEYDARLFILHPKLGQISACVTTITAPTTDGDLRLFTFVPMDKNAQVAFSSMSSGNNYVFQILPNWPQKPELEAN